MGGTVYDVPTTKKCCSNCGHSFLNPRLELKGLKGLGKFPLCTCKHPESRRVIGDPTKEVCKNFSYK